MKLTHLLVCGASALCLATTVFGQSSPGSPGAGTTTPGASGGSGSTSGASGGGASRGASSTRGLQVPQGTTRSQYFNSLDTNKDGSISKAEADASPALVIIFVESDANNDGSVSRSEFDNIQMMTPDGTAVK
jgi:hypothetical protein